MFKITIEGIADNQLGALVAQIGTKKYPVRVTHYLHPDKVDVPDPKKAGAKNYTKLTDIMSLTGKGATKGSNRAKILETLEILEVKHGIGKVDRKMLRDKLKRDGHDNQIVYQLVKGGFLKYRSAE